MEKTNWIEEYKGVNIYNKLSPELVGLLGLVNEYTEAAFGDNVEYELFTEKIIFCEETRDYLMSTPERPAYEWGSRPLLEAAVSEAVSGCATEREKVLGLMSYIRDLKEKSYGYDYFYGGTEEELIKKGERFCERVARLMCVLCEICGIPARIIHHVIGGHVVNEVYIEGKWAYVDTRFGLFYLDENMNMMSVEEIVNKPDVIYNQPEWVYEYGSKEYTSEFMMREDHELYLSKNEVRLYANYSLRDREKYHFGWMPSAKFPMPKRDEIYARYAVFRKDYIRKYFGISEDLY